MTVRPLAGLRGFLSNAGCKVLLVIIEPPEDIVIESIFTYSRGAIC